MRVAGGGMLNIDTEGLEQLLRERADAVEAAARPAAQAMAQVYYDEVKRNVAAIPQKTGNLGKSIYQVFSQTDSVEGVASYHVSWNPRKAPHGHLLENGHLQRYVTYVGSNGQIYTAKRPEAYGKPRPRRSASQAERDAYYLPLATPRQVKAYAFVRRALSKTTEAVEAGKKVILRAAANGT